MQTNLLKSEDSTSYWNRLAGYAKSAPVFKSRDARSPRAPSIMTRRSSSLLWHVVVTVSALQSVFATQVPLYPIDGGRGDTHLSFAYPGSYGSSNLPRWRLDEPPNPNATSNFVFETVHSLLQHWLNTRMRNGHAIVPGIIPTGTLLYHAVIDSKVPKTPDWVGLNTEESTAFCLKSAEGC